MTQKQLYSGMNEYGWILTVYLEFLSSYLLL